jgi:hypothetical protein
VRRFECAFKRGEDYVGSFKLEYRLNVGEAPRGNVLAHGGESARGLTKLIALNLISEIFLFAKKSFPKSQLQTDENLVPFLKASKVRIATKWELVDV